MEIKTIFIDYLKAFYSKDFDKASEFLYYNDIELFHRKVIEIANKMDEFGETDIFLSKFNFRTVAELKKLTIKQFTISILEIVKIEIAEKDFNRIINGIIITDIEKSKFNAKVYYEFPIKIFDEWQLNKGSVELIKVKDNWKILFKSGMETGFNTFHEEIDRFHQRKLKDNLSNLKFEGDLIKYTIIGFKDFSTGKIVFEPRFKDAGDFSEGLAPVQIIKKYGYINLKGELAIKPQFLFANEFSQSLASVEVETKDGVEKFGFINRRGRFVIEPIFENTRSFQNGFCAVKVNEKWGFINKKGELVIPYKYDNVEDFSYGTAVVEIYDEDEELRSFVIDKKGNIKKMY